MNLAERRARRMPTADDVYAIARRTMERLPSPFAESLDDIVLRVEDLADLGTIRRLGLRHPMQLSGLYEGVPLNLRSVDQSGTLPERVTLYLAPILAEWLAGSDSIERLVAHIVIHEIGHHFGFSDADMHALEDAGE
jgi:predicted Zn-dependent protease with MMP-like domain